MAQLVLTAKIRADGRHDVTFSEGTDLLDEGDIAMLTVQGYLRQIPMRAAVDALEKVIREQFRNVTDPADLPTSGTVIK